MIFTFSDIIVYDIKQREWISFGAELPRKIKHDFYIPPIMLDEFCICWPCIEFNEIWFLNLLNKKWYKSPKRFILNKWGNRQKNTCFIDNDGCIHIIGNSYYINHATIKINDILSNNTIFCVKQSQYLVHGYLKQINVSKKIC